MEKIDQKSIEEIAKKVTAPVKGVTLEQVKKIIELKLEDPTLGYREIGKRIGLKKDKVREVWKMAEPMLALASENEALKEPEKPSDEGKFYAKAFSTIERLLKEGFKSGDIVVKLVKKYEIVPDKAREAVEKYFEQRRLNVADLEKKWKRELKRLSRRVNELEMDTWLILRSIELGLGSPGEYKRDMCDRFRKSDGLCTYWSWSSLPSDPLIRTALVKNGNGWRLKVSEHSEHCATCPYEPSPKPPVLSRRLLLSP